MSATQKTTFALMVCAFSAATAVAQTETKWTSNTDGNWSVIGNWDNNAPDATKDAKHLTKLSRIDVNVANAVSKSFEGTGGVSDRYMLIKSGKALQVLGNLYSTTPSSRFVVKLEDGASSVTRTKLQVGTPSAAGDVMDINMNIPSGNNGEHREFTVYGDVLNSSIIGNNDTVVFINGNMIATSLRQLFLRGIG